MEVMAGETPLGPRENRANAGGEGGDMYMEDGERVIVPFFDEHG
ncbi:MAG: hypothetical protein RLZZ283_208 [Candidatus Parcubacteria bacterium]|jgi:hypothetical protein